MPSLKQRLARLSPYLLSDRRAWIVAALGSMTAAATEPMVPALMQPLLDKGFHSQGVPLWLVPLVVVALFAVRGIAGFVAQYALAKVANGAVVKLRKSLFAHLLSAGPGLFTQRSASSLTNTLVYEVQLGANQLVGGLQTLVKDTLTLLALLGYLLWLNWGLTLLVALLFPVVALVMRVLSRRLHKLTRQGQQATDELAYIVEENVLAWRIVRLHGAQDEEASRFENASLALRRLMLRSVAAGATMTPLTQVLAACVMSSVISLALWQSSGGAATVGSFVAFITGMLMLITPIKHLSDVMTPITRGLAALERGLELMDTTPTESGGGYQVDRAAGELKLQAVSLVYADGQASALDQVSLHVHAGETLAIVGPSGSGKSSLINLLPRFVNPSAGRIELDGQPLQDWNIESLRRQFALVSQDVVLFNQSIAANVALGSRVEQQRLQNALRGADLWDFVEGLPDGSATLIGHNGNRLSGGQRQRLAIARALYKDAPILILDEATSALDAESEHAVQQALELLMRGRTTLIISHRLATIERADRIVVLSGGQRVEQGTHAELMAAAGVYAKLHAMQFRG